MSITWSVQLFPRTQELMGKYQSRLGFKSRFEPFRRFDLRCKNLFWNTAIRFFVSFIHK